jgi:hypothetical protein
MKQLTKKVTFFVIPTLIILILVYDVWAIIKGGTESSISAFLIKASYEMPFMVFCIGFFNGVLVGHLFWRMKPNGMTKEIDESRKP